MYHIVIVFTHKVYLSIIFVVLIADTGYGRTQAQAPMPPPYPGQSQQPQPHSTMQAAHTARYVISYLFYLWTKIIFFS